MGTFLGSINFDLIINLVTYIAFALIILGEVFKGFRRGVISASVRLGVFAGLMVVALFIATPIANALMGIDVSFLNIEIDGELQTTIPAIIKGYLYQSEAIANAAASSPALTAIIDGLPVAILSLVVFFILIWVFKLISYAVFKILDRWALPSSKLQRAYKKQLKIQKKALKKGEKVVAVTLPVPPERHRWAGAAVGLVMGILVAFCVYLPFGATFGLIEDIAGSSEMTAEAEEEFEEESSIFENLNQTSGEIVRYYLPKEAMESIDTYNNSFIAKFVSFGGFDNVIYDYLTKIKVNGNDIKFRQEVLNFTEGFDSVVELLHQRQNSPEGWKGLSIESIENAFNKILNSNLLGSLIPELTPYVLENYIYTSSFFANIPSSETVKIDIQNLINYYQENGFMKCLTEDINPLFRLAESALDTNIINEFTTSTHNIDNIISCFKENDNALLNSSINLLFDSRLIKLGASIGVNYAEKIVNEKLALTPGLKYVDSTFFNSEEKQSIKDLAISVFDAYNTVKDVDFEHFEISDISDDKIKGIANILTAVQNNVFKKYENGVLVLRADAVVDKTNKTVIGGGMFSNVYITAVDYLLGNYLSSINYKDVNWKDVLKSVQQLASSESIGADNIEDIVNLLSLDENLAVSAKTILDGISDLDANKPMTNENVVEILGAVSTGLTSITEEKFDNIINQIASNTGMEDIATKVTYDYIEEASTFVTHLANLYDDDEVTSSEANAVIEDLVKYDFILEKVAEIEGLQLPVAESEKDSISTKITEATNSITNESEKTNIQNYLKTIFGIQG